MIMGVMAAVFRLYQVIRWGLEVALAVAANGERVAAGAKRAPAPADAVATVAAALAAGVRVGVGGGEEDAVNFYVLYIYICRKHTQDKVETEEMGRPHLPPQTKEIRRRPIWDPMPLVLILEDKGGA